jgi:hypothetical protein
MSTRGNVFRIDLGYGGCASGEEALDHVVLTLMEPLGCQKISDYRKNDCIKGYCIKVDSWREKKATAKLRDDHIILVTVAGLSENRIHEITEIPRNYIKKIQ